MKGGRWAVLLPRGLFEWIGGILLADDFERTGWGKLAPLNCRAGADGEKGLSVCSGQPSRSWGD